MFMSDRQAAILQTIVDYYVQSASPVGSRALAQHFNVSSATIRAEMAVLEKLGYITHPHTSAGRIPTDAGYRHYIKMQQEPSRKIDATARMRHGIAQAITSAGSPQAAIKVATNSLAHITQNIAFASMGQTVHI